VRQRTFVILHPSSIARIEITAAEWTFEKVQRLVHRAVDALAEYGASRDWIVDARDFHFGASIFPSLNGCAERAWIRNPGQTSDKPKKSTTDCVHKKNPSPMWPGVFSSGRGVHPPARHQFTDCHDHRRCQTKASRDVTQMKEAAN
jgi:hypothetical protein